MSKLYDNKEITLANLIDFIRKHQGLAKNQAITGATLLEKDLGITGGDGCELLEAIQKQFNVSFIGADNSIRELFSLQDDEYLFHSEGFSLFSLLARLFGHDIEKVKALSIGQLFQAICLAKNKTDYRYR